MKDSGPWLAIGGIGAFAVAAVLAWSLVSPTWDQGETSALLGALVACPTIGVMIGGIFLGLHWRDERQAERREKEASKRQRSVDRAGQDATVFGMNTAMMRQAIDVMGAMAQAQARQSMAGLTEARRDAFQARAIDAPAQQDSWFTGDWDYGDEDTEVVEATSGVRYL